MSPVTDRELKALRKAQETWMPNSVRVERRKYVGDDKYLSEQVDEAICRITPGFGQWSIIADRFQGITPFTITMPVGTDVLSGDHLFDAYGRKFLVRDVAGPKDYVTALRLLAEMVTDG